MREERSVALYVDDMLECIERIEGYCAGVTADEFAANSLLQDAVSRRLGVNWGGRKARAARRAIAVPWHSMA